MNLSQRSVKRTAALPKLGNFRLKMFQQRSRKLLLLVLATRRRRSTPIYEREDGAVSRGMGETMCGRILWFNGYSNDQSVDLPTPQMTTLSKMIHATTVSQIERISSTRRSSCVTNIPLEANGSSYSKYYSLWLYMI